MAPNNLKTKVFVLYWSHSTLSPGVKLIANACTLVIQGFFIRWDESVSRSRESFIKLHIMLILNPLPYAQVA